MINKFTLLLFVLVSCRNGSSPLFAGPAPRADTPTPGAPLSASDGTEVYATADDGTLLRWTVFAPLGMGKHPAVLVIHGGGFVAAPASPNTKMAARDLAVASFQQQLTLPGNRHAFAYWPDVKDQAIAFLRAGFARHPPAAHPSSEKSK